RRPLPGRRRSRRPGRGAGRSPSGAGRPRERGGWASPPSDPDVFLQPGEAAFADARHAQQVAGRPEPPSPGALLEDRPGGGGADARQRVEGGEAGGVEVDRLDRFRGALVTTGTV